MENNEKYLALEEKVAALSDAVETLTKKVNQMSVAQHYFENPVERINNWTAGKATRKAQAVALALVAEGMSLRQVSNILNISTATISQMLNDKYPWGKAEKDKPIPTLTDLLLEIKETTEGN